MLKEMTKTYPNPSLDTSKVGTHEGTSRRDLFQGLVRCRVYTMGQVAGTSPLRGPVTHRNI